MTRLRSPLLTLLALFLAHQVSWGAVNQEVPPQEVELLVEKIRKAKARLAQSEKQRRETLGRLYEIKTRMRKVSDEKSRLTNEMLVLRGNIKNFAQMIVRLENTIAEQKRKIIRRIRGLGQLGKLGYAKVILSESRVSEVERTMRFLKIVASRDFELLRNYQENVRNLTRKRDELNHEVEQLLAVERKIATQEALIASEHNNKKEILARLEGEVFKSSDRISEIRKSGRSILNTEEVDEEVRDMFGPFFFEQKGKLALPVTADVERGFGLFSQGSNIRLIHKGVSFRAQGSMEIKSVFGGRVAFVGPLRGRGLTVVLNHGDSYYTVYSRLKEVHVKGGQAVASQEVLGKTKEALGRGRGLYFEVRHFSIPEDPTHWLTKGELHLSGREADEQHL